MSVSRSTYPSGARLSAAPAAMMRLLLVDDDDLVRRALARVLRRSYAITEAASAEAALDLLRGGDRFDGILCDRNLTGMSGDEFLLKLVASGDPHVERLVLVSGSPSDTLAPELFERIGGRFLEKPVSASEVARAVSALLSAHSAHPRAA